MTIGGIITAIIFGAIIGSLGRLIVPGKQDLPVWLTVVAGIVAAFVGTALANAFDLETRGWNFWETLFQIAAAVIIVAVLAALWPKRRAGTDARR
ncbi:GlsB/YeaQ/YmgE family stress response membrane protein [Actinomadura sp. NBRC 104412]|uniref:GlsB/YeaQ/YmgE family stress response membrane protein n=1 Tax=Actinomadura sp. NBRC 104412 TaxID=3032203 RepID=UPI002556E15C|nr:GlsB/YeaQ/YmgE family stress response membrane protein [Actinomadura sp. NBRC 104412]